MRAAAVTEFSVELTTIVCCRKKVYKIIILPKNGKYISYPNTSKKVPW